jgi:hypothetical protein
LRKSDKNLLDTPLLGEIQTAVAWGILNEGTTDPTLTARAGRAFKENIVVIKEAIGFLKEKSESDILTLVFSAKDTEHNNVVALKTLSRSKFVVL